MPSKGCKAEDAHAHKETNQIEALVGSFLNQPEEQCAGEVPTGALVNVAGVVGDEREKEREGGRERERM